MSRYLIIIYLFIVGFFYNSCSISNQTSRGCDTILREISNKFKPIHKVNGIQIYEISYISKDSLKQREEFENMVSEFLFPNRYNCLIGINKDRVIKFLGISSNDYKKNNQNVLTYYIKRDSYCGTQQPSKTDLIGDTSDGCYILEFSFDKNNKVTDMALH